jgi:hypothetical protein
LLRPVFCSVASHGGKAAQICHSVRLSVSLLLVVLFALRGSCTAVLRQPTFSARSPAAGIRPTSCTPREAVSHFQDTMISLPNLPEVKARFLTDSSRNESSS